MPISYVKEGHDMSEKEEKQPIPPRLRGRRVADVLGSDEEEIEAIFMQEGSQGIHIQMRL